ncbi:MAG: hypothetical protein D6800_07380 [Candidatus Zixiibacteriota bacterium]|nr:MAG: hypothetical protein D6800_07380 [candidate division Zixibacteria bacterium]
MDEMDSLLDDIYVQLRLAVSHVDRVISDTRGVIERYESLKDQTWAGEQHDVHGGVAYRRFRRWRPREGLEVHEQVKVGDSDWKNDFRLLPNEDDLDWAQECFLAMSRMQCEYDRVVAAIDRANATVHRINECICEMMDKLEKLSHELGY